MTRPDPQRWLPLSGVAFAAVMVVAAVAFPKPPGEDVSPGTHPSWLTAHANAVIAQSYVRAVAAIALLLLAVALARAIRRSAPDSAAAGAVLTAGALSAALLLLAQAVGVASALYLRRGGTADTAHALGQLQDGFLDLGAIPGALLFTVAGLAGWRYAVLPRWLAGVSLLGLPVALADSASYDGSPLHSLGLLGLLYLIAWALLVGVRLCIDARPVAQPVLLIDDRQPSPA